MLYHAVIKRYAVYCIGGTCEGNAGICKDIKKTTQ